MNLDPLTQLADVLTTGPLRLRFYREALVKDRSEILARRTEVLVLEVKSLKTFSQMMLFRSKFASTSIYAFFQLEIVTEKSK